MWAPLSLLSLASQAIKLDNLKQCTPRCGREKKEDPMLNVQFSSPTCLTISTWCSTNLNSSPEEKKARPRSKADRPDEKVVAGGGGIRPRGGGEEVDLYQVDSYSIGSKLIYIGQLGFKPDRLQTGLGRVKWLSAVWSSRGGEGPGRADNSSFSSSKQGDKRREET